MKTQSIDGERAAKGLLGAWLVVLLFITPCLGYDGDQLWNWNHGIKIDEAVGPGTLSHHQPVADGVGGVYVVYRKAVSLTPTWDDYQAAVRVKHLDEDGLTLWNTLASSQSNGKTWSPVACEDRIGNVIVAWVEGPIDPPPSQPYNFMGSGYRVQAQKLNGSGSRLWPSDAILSTKAYQDIFSLSLKICPDGIGGAYIGWGSRLTHVNKDGTPTAPGLDGIEVVPGSSGGYQFVYDEASSFIIDNGQWIQIPGGVYAAWKNTSGSLFGQLVHGSLQWGVSGMEIADFINMGNFDLAVDNDGNLLVLYGGQPTASTSYQIRAQKINTSGSKQWLADGRLVLNSADVGGSWSSVGGGLAIAPDDIGGAIVSWQDYRHPSVVGNIDLYAQRLNDSGLKMWTKEVLLPPYTVGDTAPGEQGLPRMVPDGADGAVVVYQDKGGFSWDIAATRVSEEGARLWSQWVFWDGTSFSDPGLNQNSPAIAFDDWGSPGGVFVTWYEYENSHHRVYAEKVEVSSTAPINDDCGNATVLYPGNLQVGSLAWATNDGNAGCGDSLYSVDVWYKVTPQGSGVLNLNTCGSNDIGGLDNGIDTALSVHSACPGTTSNQIVCNDDWDGGGIPAGACNGVDQGTSTRDSAVSLPVLKNQTYYVRVSHYASSKLGPFRLNSELLVQTSLEGDFNYDEDVDGKDLQDFSEFYPGSIEADLTGDGRVDEADVAMFAGQFGLIHED